MAYDPIIEPNYLVYLIKMLSYRFMWWSKWGTIVCENCEGEQWYETHKGIRCRNCDHRIDFRGDWL